MRQSTIDRAVGRWPEILSQLGIDPSHLRNRHGPCPICGGKDRFRFDDKGGTGSWYCEGCEPRSGYGIHLAMNWTGKSMPEVSAEIDEIIGNTPAPVPAPQKQRDPRPALRNLAQRAELLGERISPVRQYLRSRGVSPSVRTRYVASQAYWEDGQKIGSYPCMAHLVVDKDNQPATWHLTYLDERGNKADVSCPRKIMTPSREWKGGAVRLFEASPVLGIAEGIETALAASKLFARPVWAALNANNLAEFVVPRGVKRVLIFGDNDSNYTGQAAAYALARRLKVREKLEVEVHIPSNPGTDWVDELEEAREAQEREA